MYAWNVQASIDYSYTFLPIFVDFTFSFFECKLILHGG